MATREAPRRSTRAKQFAFKYFEQVHKRVKELEQKRDAEQPKRQPLIYRGEASGVSQAAQITQTEIQAGETLCRSWMGGGGLSRAIHTIQLLYWQRVEQGSGNMGISFLHPGEEFSINILSQMVRHCCQTLFLPHRSKRGQTQ